MTQIKNNINTYADLTAYNADTNKDYPNVSYIEGTDEVKYGTDPRVVCIYNITDTSAATKLLNATTGLNKMWIDDVLQTSIVTEYQFDTTGQHTVKYLLNGTVMEQNVFNRCSAITSVIIPNIVTRIRNLCFEYCTGINTNITIPTSITNIGNYAFNGCHNITNMTVEATTPPTLGDYPFNTVGSGYPIYVPAESVETYKAASGWSTYASRIQAIPSV